MIERLCEKIFSDNQFQEELEDILVSSSFLDRRKNTSYDSENYKKLIESSLILASSKNSSYRNAAYDICTSILKLTDEKSVRELSYITLNRLGNIPAMELLNGDIHPAADLPNRIFFECANHIQKNSIAINGENRVLTDFQRETWETLELHRHVSISAPTSAGKSFLILNFIKKLSSKPNFKCCYLVPTRALINQVTTDLHKIGIDENCEISSIPRKSEADRVIYVLTQERLNTILVDSKGLKFDLLVTDEAQSINDDSRGVLLQSVIKECTSRNENLRTCFISPNIKNPEFFLKQFSEENSRVSKTTEQSVSQRLLFVDAINTNEYCVSLKRRDRKIPIKNFTVQQNSDKHEERIAIIAEALSSKSDEHSKEKSIIYANGKAECEDIARALCQIVKVDSSYSKERAELSSLVTKSVHKDYKLADFVKYGVGFHYGNMPLLIRQAIEEAYISGHLDYLICTSTLLQGVNLPAKNIFLLNPEKGPDKPLKSFDFWNLIGRAGRARVEYFGQIYLIDYASWKSYPLDGSKETSVKSAFNDFVSKSTESIIEYSQDREPKELSSSLLESASVKLYLDFLSGDITKTLDKESLSESEVTKMKSVFRETYSYSRLSHKTLSHSPSISPHRQNALYSNLLERISKKGPAYVIPAHPLNKDAYSSYLRTIRRLHTYLAGKSGKDKSHLYFATIILKWMRGEPLPMLIDNQAKQRKNKGKNSKMSTIIRSVLDTIEKDIRFTYVNYFTCLQAVLIQALEDTDNEKFIAKVPSLPLYLELGASSKTMISLMELGASRVSASMINSQILNKSMSKLEVLAFISSQKFKLLDLPPRISEELSSLRT